MTGTALFVVGAGPQLDAVRRVITHLQRPAQVFDLDRAVAVAPADYEVGSHVTRATISSLRAVAAATRSWAKSNPDGVLVIPQDVGLSYRRIVAVARKAGLPIVLLPDGAVSDVKIPQRSLLGGAVPAADAVLRWTGVMAGVHGVMAASKPDLVLSWGHGWDAIYRSRHVGRITDVGNPRADDLDSLAPPQGERVLVCSQPHWQPTIGGDVAQTAWYAFLERLVGMAPAGQIAVRLHPWERDTLDELPVGPATRAALTHGTSLHEDISWSGSVLSWASTTMLEAAGARRPVVSVAVNRAAADIARSYVFLRDRRMVGVGVDELVDWSDVLTAVEKARARQTGLAEDYLVNVGSAAKACAETLDAYSPC